MKNLSLVLNIVLLIAVAFLFYKVYSDKKPATLSLPVASGNNTVVYVDADTLFEKYSLFKKLNEEFDKKRDSVDNILRSKDASLKQEAAVYQQQAEQMSNNERMAKEEELMKKNSILLKLKDDLYEQLRVNQQNMEDSIHNNLHGFLKEFNKDKNYAFVLSYQRGSGVLLANDSLNITNQVLEGLNRKK